MGICTTLALTISLSSYHLTHKYQPSYNEVNPGISIECNQYEAGVYKNSINRTSYHAGFIFKKDLNSDIMIGSNVGLVSGYLSNPVPYARPFIQYKNIRIGYIPAFAEFQVEEVITFEYSMNF